MTKKQYDELSKPLPKVDWKAQATNGKKARDGQAAVPATKALGVAYIDARTVMALLDSVVGAGEWYDEYEVVRQPTATEKPPLWVVKCTLVVGEAQKQDVGEGEAAKDAFSDALKRAAVKFGIGRFLYAIPKTWAEFKPDFSGNGGKFTDGGLKALDAAYARFLSSYKPGTTYFPGDDESGDDVGDDQPTSTQPPTTTEPSKPDPHAVIDELVSRLRGKGFGQEAAQLTVKYGGYGKTLDETRALYKELKALLDQPPAVHPSPTPEDKPIEGGQIASLQSSCERIFKIPKGEAGSADRAKIWGLAYNDGQPLSTNQLGFGRASWLLTKGLPHIEAQFKLHKIPVGERLVALETLVEAGQAAFEEAWEV